MGKKKDITVDDLNKSLKKIGRDARRVNKAKGRNTVYAEDGYLIEITPSGEKRRSKKLEEEDNEVSHSKRNLHHLLP